AVTGAAVPGVQLVHHIEAKLGPVADAEGRLRLHHTGEEAMAWLGEVAGYSSFTWHLPAGVDAPERAATFPLRALETLTGRVVDSAGRALEGVNVSARPMEVDAAERIEGLPGAVTWSARSRRSGSETWRPALTDSDGCFAAAVIQSEAPWRVIAYVKGRSSPAAIVHSLDQRPELVLEDPPESITSTVRGRLVRGGEPWGDGTWVRLAGAAREQGPSQRDGTFALTTRNAGACELIVRDRVVARFDFDGAAHDLGDVALDDLPLLSLRCETSAGAPWRGTTVWIVAARPGDGAQGVPPVTHLGETTDADGRVDVLLPHVGDYVLHLAPDTVLATEELAIAGDVEHVLRVAEPRTLELRLIDAQTRAPLVLDFDLQVGIASWRRPGEPGWRYVLGQAYGDGVLALSLPDEPLEVLLRAWSRGYRTQRLDPARLSTAVPGLPLDVPLELGRTLEVELEGLERVPRSVSLVWLHESDFALVRPALSQPEAAALTARGESAIFFDPHLSAQGLGTAPNGRAVVLRGLADGRHTILAYDAYGRRPDVQFEPAVFEVGPGVASVHLTLAPR
ncbi:MAG TPA: hypothetical protein VMT18_06860, partial [Planctomycetota bacterium]|nr:hypothetical protein [Planctomycetota bacterium]